MSGLSQPFFDAHQRGRRIGQVDHPIRDAKLRTTHGPRYSSPWPWISALAITLAMWASLAWLIWGR
jgi:hypothetical protein